MNLGGQRTKTLFFSSGFFQVSNPAPGAYGSWGVRYGIAGACHTLPYYHEYHMYSAGDQPSAGLTAAQGLAAHRAYFIYWAAGRGSATNKA
jgi:hypothetical protein